MPPDGSEFRVVCCIDDTRARRRVEEALHREGLRASHKTVGELTNRGEAELLIYDFKPWNEDALGLVQSLTNTVMVVPVLLYVPATLGVEDLLTEAVKYPGVSFRQQHSHRHEVERLRTWIRDQRRQASMFTMQQLMQTLVPDTSWVVREFIKHTTVDFTQAQASRRTVADVAQDMGVSIRQLERVFLSTTLPVPREFLGWMTLLSLTWTATQQQCSTVHLSKQIGMDSNALYRLRRRIVPNHPPLAGVPPSREFNIIFLAFAERIRVPRASAADILRRKTA